jgi:hypothetical protein
MPVLNDSNSIGCLAIVEKNQDFVICRTTVNAAQLRLVVPSSGLYGTQPKNLVVVVLDGF